MQTTAKHGCTVFSRGFLPFKSRFPTVLPNATRIVGMMMLHLILCLFCLLHAEAEVFSSVNPSSTTATTSNYSTPLFTNTTSNDQANFSYIIPHGQIQECDIYGPLCQTGKAAFGPLASSISASTGTSAIASVRNTSRLFASVAPKTEQRNISNPTAKLPSQISKHPW